MIRLWRAYWRLQAAYLRERADFEAEPGSVLEAHRQAVLSLADFYDALGGVR